MKRLILFLFLCEFFLTANSMTYLRLCLNDGQVINSCSLIQYTSDSLYTMGHEIKLIYGNANHTFIPKDIEKLIVLSSDDYIKDIIIANNQFMSKTEYKQYKKQITKSIEPAFQEVSVKEPQINTTATTTAKDIKPATPTKNAVPYHKSFGINVGNRLGLSYKTRKKTFGFILDIDWQIDNTIMSGSTGFYGWDFGISPNFVGHKTLKVSNNGNLSWYGGGGFGVGIAEQFPQSNGNITPKYTATKDILAKIGAHFITGAEYAFAKIPLCLSADFRPGFCYYAGIGNGTGVQGTLGLDWSIGLSVRYCY